MRLRKVILSRGRHESINTHNLLSKFDLVVPESELLEYKMVVENAENIVGIPDDIHGLGSVRNWVLDHYEDEIVVMFDDDIKHFISVLNLSPVNITKPEMIDQIINNIAVCCMDAGLSLFGLSQFGDVRKYEHTQPFLLNSWTGTIVGIIGRKHRFTEINKLKVDADFTLQKLLDDRIVWIDARYTFSCVRDSNKGGNSLYRSQARIDKEVDFLKRKWKDHIKISSMSSQGKANGKYSLKLNVKRRARGIK